MFEEFKQKLKRQLSQELPGEEAHLMMMPTARDESFKFPIYKKAPVESAVLVLFYSDGSGNIKFPLIQRPTYNGAHSGQISFPGGKAEKSDRDLVHTALREAAEEIGIIPEDVDVVGRLSELHIAISNFVVTPVVGFMTKKPQFVMDMQEVEEVIEADLHDIIKPEKRKEGMIVIREKYKIQTPYFDIGNRVVWGATAMMLNELSVMIKEAELK
jgi:8-oxo-dGTP pyrophosphatase MutT (NUDIX family)